MPANDLNEPLFRGPDAPAPRRQVVAPTLISAALVVAVLAALWIAVVDDPDGGRSVAVARISDPVPASTGSVAADGAAGADGGAASQPPIGPIGQELAAAWPSAPPSASAAPGLLEHSAFGPLPRVSPDGRRPRDAYARPAPAAAPGAPRIVVVVGGMGMSQTGTQNAIEALPEDVTLAFATLGSSLQRWADAARGEGHEILLQIPFEPVNYPEVNPGEHTLLVSADRPRSRQDLYWNLGRMTAYAGVTNHMGGRFTGEDSAMLPFLGEIGERGLFYLDDGSSPQSRAASIGEALAVPVLTADVIIDRDRSAAAIEQSLADLEAIAAARGTAIGVASAFPASVEAIARWVEDAGARGIVIVPASAALN